MSLRKRGYSTGSSTLGEQMDYPKWTNRLSAWLKKKAGLDLLRAKASAHLDNVMLHSWFTSGQNIQNTGMLILKMIGEQRERTPAPRQKKVIPQSSNPLSSLVAEDVFEEVKAKGDSIDPLRQVTLPHQLDEGGSASSTGDRGVDHTLHLMGLTEGVSAGTGGEACPKCKTGSLSMHESKTGDLESRCSSCDYRRGV